MLPRRLRNFNVFAAGYSLLGMAEEVTLPKLTRKMEEYRAAGMDAPIKVDMGQEVMEMEITSAEISPDLLKTWATSDPAGVILRFRAALERDAADPATAGLEVLANGRFSEIDLATAKPGDKHQAKYKLDCVYLKITEAGEEIIEIDAVNMILKVGGIDRLAAQRAALGI